MPSMTRSSCTAASACASLLLALAVDHAAFAQEGSRLNPQLIGTKEVPNQPVVFRRSNYVIEGGAAGTCPPQTSSLTNANFEGGQFVVQAGFVETEIAAASYTIPASAFPIRLDMAEMIFATSAATVQTTTKWSIFVWSGTPATGQVVFQFSSDGDLLPHIVLPPGTNGVNVQFMVDPSDPEQIYITDDGSHTFSIGYRIDDHNNQSGTGCVTPPPPESNAFPTTDVGGLQNSTKNWLYQFNCGAFGCGSGWTTFAALPSLCRPSGDWVMRATWTSMADCGSPIGACCQAGNCAQMTAADCQSIAGTYKGDGVACQANTCTVQPGPCCFAATGGCLNLTADQCLSAGGVPGPAGTSCAGYTCFPTGACCLADGTCVGPVSPTECSQLGGTYKGNNSTCATVTCPPPVGAACFPNGFCLQLTQADALAAGATWRGPGTVCTDANSNGIPDGCERFGDINGDNKVDGTDLGLLLGAWGPHTGAADLDHSGVVDGTDIGLLLGAWGP